MTREEEVLEMILQACRNADAKEVILFGSRAKGTNGERSDFDIAVSGVENMNELREAVDDLPTLYEVDVVDLDSCRNELLREDIAVYGRKIYEKI